jgi:hypothetical protein
MTDRPMPRDDAFLEVALRSLAGEIDWPPAAPATADGTTTGPDIATRVRVRLSSGERRRSRRWWSPGGRPVRRSLVFAIVALLALAIVAGAVGLGLPGLRIMFGEAPASLLPSPVATDAATDGATSSSSPTPTPTLPPIAGMRLNLGRQVELDEVQALAGVVPRLPADERLGPPDSVWVDSAKSDQVAYVWKAGPSLPETSERGVGLILMRFAGRSDDEFYQKVLSSGTRLQTVTVDGHDGFWISGEMHFFFYERPDGTGYVDDGRRWVGDALIWSDGRATYRIESALGRDATIALAESIE